MTINQRLSLPLLAPENPCTPWRTSQALVSNESAFPLPLLVLCYQRPSDGLPLLQDWRSNALDIYSNGFESFRESVEIRFSRDPLPDRFGYGDGIPVKGLGKVSILFFGLLFTYLQLRDSLTPEEMNDFTRPWGLKGSPFDIMEMRNLKGDGFNGTVAFRYPANHWSPSNSINI